MEYSEFSGKTVDDAITEACQNLMVTSDRLDYEVVEKGSSGFLGIGTKLATIKARIKDDSDVEESKDAGEKKDSVKYVPLRENKPRADERKATWQNILIRRRT